MAKPTGRSPLHGLTIGLLALGWASVARAEEPAGAGESETLAVQRDGLRVEWREAEGEFRLSAGSGGAYGRLRFERSPRELRVVDWRHATLGSGRAIEFALEGTGGDRARVGLFPALPFALVRVDLAGRPSQERVVRQVSAFSLDLDRPDPAQGARALGTAGLTAPDHHPGSYTFLALANPATRRGVVSGWVTSDRGSGVIFSDVSDGAIHVRARLDYGRLHVRAGGRVEGELFAVGEFDDARLGLEAWADAAARVYRIRLPPVPSGYCTWYSRPHGGASDEEHVLELASSAAEKLAPYGFDFVQIDDHWQQGARRNGPAKVFTTHNPKGPYPSGMKRAADGIRALGLVPGIWFMPFAGDRHDPFFAEHQDWFVKRADGSPYWARWGGTSLDLTNPAARAYVGDVAHRIARDWGYRYFKLDGLWTGTATKLTYVNNGYVEDDMGEAVFHDSHRTAIEAYRDGLELVRAAAGPDVFLLGCNVSQNMRTLGASFGLVDAMRIGPDNGPGWGGLLRGPWHGTNRYFLHGRVWYNDPDPIYVRASVPLEHARLIASWVAVSGQLGVFSEWLPDLPEERVEILRRTLPNHGLRPRPVDLFESPIARIWHLGDERSGARRDIVALFNWKEKEPEVIDEPLERIGLGAAERFVGFDFWANRFVAPFSGRLACTLAAGSCRVLALRAAADHPQVVSTSRHVTQGIIDLVEESWEEGSTTLRGRSHVVGGDRYELRIAVPSGEDSWRLLEPRVSGEDREAEVEVSGAQKSEGVRVRIRSPASRTVSWRVVFRRRGRQRAE